MRMMEKIISIFLTMYYKGGVDDPDFIIIKFTAQSGRYYGNFSSQDFTIE
jgi:general stress protein 26